jgi:hypothetical protein
MPDVPGQPFDVSVAPHRADRDAAKTASPFKSLPEWQGSAKVTEDQKPSPSSHKLGSFRQKANQ